MESNLFSVSGIVANISFNSYVEWANFGIALLTNIESGLLFVTGLIWWWNLRGSKRTDFGGWFLGTAVLAFSLWLWSLKGIRLSIDPDRRLPLDTIYERVGIMLGLYIKIWFATKRPRYTRTKRLLSKRPTN